MKLVRPTVLSERDARQRVSRVDQDKVVSRVAGERIHHRVKAVDDGGHDVQTFGKVIAGELERRLKPGPGANGRRSVRDGIVIAMPDYGRVRRDDLPQLEQVVVGGRDGVQSALKARRVQPEPW